MKINTHDLNHDLILSVFKVLGIYNFGKSAKTITVFGQKIGISAAVIMNRKRANESQEKYIEAIYQTISLPVPVWTS